MTFDRNAIDAKYQKLGYKKGWTFLMCPEKRISTAEVAIVGLNPGGGGEKDSYTYERNWDVPEGNAYFTENWGADGTGPTPVQQQVRAWHAEMNLQPDDTLCAQFVPFRSPDWERLGNWNEAVAFARELWTWMLTKTSAKTFIAMGNLAGCELARLLDCQEHKTFYSGWGNTTIKLDKNGQGRRVITMPHPSRYLLFGRAGNASVVAKESFHRALTE